MKDSIWNNDSTKFVKECKRLCMLCNRIMNGQESIISGCIKMSQYRFWMKEEDNSNWDIFMIVSSDTDHLPIGDVREYWSTYALKEKDLEIGKIEIFYREDVVKAIKNIFQQYRSYIDQIKT